MEDMIKPDNLDSVDRLMRYLDLPFNPDIWTKIYEHNPDHTLTAYLNTLSDDAYCGLNWRDENEKWKEARELGTAASHIKMIDKARFDKMRQDWSPEYTNDELVFLENYYQQILLTQNVSTPIYQQLARDLCEVELRIKKGLRSGADVKKDMDARDNIIKIAQFDSSNSKNAADFETVGELITYYVKQGWHPVWHEEPQDSVDFTMQNIQAYLRRLVNNEGNFAEQVEDKKASFEMTQRLEDNNDSDFVDYDEGSEVKEFEGEDDLAGDLSDWDIN